jgi:ABC-type bacteriocin/lantibiotic exporter with double-glycine peptidase domain
MDGGACMRLQDTQANCGPASLSNALQAVGVIRSQGECEQLCKTTGVAGTTSKNIIAAVKAVGRNPLVIDEKRAETAALFLDHWLRSGRPAVLCVDDWTHWVAAIGVLGDRVLVADPADNELVIVLSRARLVERWGCKNRYYGVVL